MNGLTCILVCFMVTNLSGQIQITKRDITCRGGNDGYIFVYAGNVTPPVTYTWNDGFTGANRHSLSAGSYVVTVTDATKCDHTKLVVIEEPDEKLKLKIQSIYTPPPHECHTPIPVYIRVEATGGVPPYNINGTQANHRVFKFDVTTTFTFSVTDKNGCKKESTRKILVGQHICAVDPNDIAGPSGYDTLQWVSVNDTLPYTIRFENDPQLASGPAKRVLITHQFDEDVNPYTFRLGTFGFGDFSFDIPQTLSSFQKRFDFTAQNGFYVDVVAGLNVQENRAFWQLVTIDPATNQEHTDPFVGFLPVNDTLTGSGEGFVNFSIRPKSGTLTGDTIVAAASIVFDQNDPIITNTWTNTVDAFAPTTQLEELDSMSISNAIPLSWNGSDDPGGSGMRAYEIFVSRNGEPFETAFLSAPDTLSHTFIGEYGSTYSFYVEGIDNVDNHEIKMAGEAQVTILPKWEIDIDQNLQDVYCVLDTFYLDFSTIMVDIVDIFFSSDSGVTLVPLTIQLDSAIHPVSWIVPDTLAGLQIRFYVMASDSTEIRDSSSIYLVQGLPEIDAGEDLDLCDGEIRYLIPSGANDYYWTPQIGLNFQESAIQTFIADTSSVFYVSGADEYGCINTDSIIIHVYPHTLDTIEHLMCNQDSVYAGGAYQTEPGYYTDALASIHGCDSTVVTHVILTGPCTFPSPQMYVDQDAVGLNDGTSWANAFIKLSDALQASREWANVNAIWIAEGVYSPHPTLRDSSFILKDSIKIYGGFLGVETMLEERSSDPELVFLSGDINVSDTLWDNSYHTVILDSTCVNCVLDGLTIHYGYADQVGNDTGAGVLNAGTGLFKNVVFERNFATELGAAVYSSGSSASLVFDGCTFRLNTSSLGRDVVNLNGAQVLFTGFNSLY